MPCQLGTKSADLGTTALMRQACYTALQLKAVRVCNTLRKAVSGVLADLGTMKARKQGLPNSSGDALPPLFQLNI